MPSTKPTLAERLGPVVYLAGNWISRAGILLVTAAGVSWLFTLPASLGGSEHPYLGLLTVFLLPALFFLGLAAIPLGIYVQSRRSGNPPEFPPARWENPRFRSLVLFIGGATALNVIIGGHFTHSAVAHMDSVEFCGTSCHIMTPEFTAYKVATHSQVACVDCHIGAGAESYIRAKINGSKQLLEVLTGTAPAVVPTPVHNLAQGLLTCSKCHADRDFGGKRWEATRFSQDETNAATRTRLTLAIGGGSNAKGAHGAHMANGARIEYGATRDRTVVDWVRYRAPGGRETLYQRGNRKSAAEPRTMDCTDCHNRAAHSFEDPARALDQSLAAGRIDHTLPKIKAQGLALLKDKSGNIGEALRAFYQSRYPAIAAARMPGIAKAAEELAAIRGRNVFPEWGVDWGTHPNYQGHLGCFRCHNEELVSQDERRQPIGKNCSTCHRIETMDEPVADPVMSAQSPSASSIPAKIDFNSVAGAVPFDHSRHVSRAKGECSACHDRLFPMGRAALRYAGNTHRTAEAARSSCAGCHAPGGAAFAAGGSCARCHTNLSEPMGPLKSVSSAAPALPGVLRYPTPLGTAKFDHSAHVTLAKGECTACHNRLFPMAKADLGYAGGLHLRAEAARASCAGCHAPAAPAFAASGNCQRCHDGLGAPRPTPSSGQSGLPDSRAIETRLGPAKFDHPRHVQLANNDCQSCHNRIFPLAKGMLGYADNLHRTAEQNRTSCGACHRESGVAFPSKSNCLHCHTELKARGAVAALEKPVQYANRLGRVSFDHKRHIREAGGACSQCHDKIFPMERRGLAGYAADYHRVAEARGELCAACHAPGKMAFATLNNCRRCHQGLEVQRAN